ncbi:3-dehydroquinate synthase [Brevibacillus daliensis]|uniref:3-dehydroquinate synthase n=1 Tax=Brevibacillus daliensis TaxID=2892995 RepID=UPI001E5D5095|nr:3-dehydroquinate synthase [Brevibacillus daliensis]
MNTKQVTVELGERTYQILIGSGLLEEVTTHIQQVGIKGTQKLFIVTDTNVAPYYLEKIKAQLADGGYQVATFIVSAGEKAKQFAVYEEVMTAAIEAKLDRKSVVLALGGGVVGDLAGFVAATYMRGISFIQIPTTLLAHDSSVGGKVAINHRLGKNLVGAFHQPLLVLYDVSTLTSLPKREIAAGFAEIIKHGLISDEGFVRWLEEHADELKQLHPELLAEAIYRGCAVKTNVVSEDETEQGIRAILNLGHTFGHAFEALCGYQELNHGEAISVGMVLAARFAEQEHLAPQGVAKRTSSVLSMFDLPVSWPKEMNPDNVLEVMERDKKGVAGQINLILPTSIGHVQIVPGIAIEKLQKFLRDEWEESKK